jgi:hypothetical protein
MLPETYKADILEIIGIAKECPEPLQAKCLEMLLEDYLKRSGSSARKTPPAKEIETKPPTPADKPEEGETVVLPNDVGNTPSGQRDLVPADVHLKAKKFLNQYSLTLDDLNQLFFIEGDEIKPLYDDLKTTKASETQIRIGLLQALRTGITDGEFQFDGEEVREECQERKAYDKNNFPANFKNSASLFVGFDKYDKNSPVLKLTEAGRARLAETIRELK